MDLIEIGRLLREERERRGLSVEKVEERTKISPAVIIALEEGSRERFPHPVYARGFVRSYSLLLGLDAEELCGHFAREYPVPSEPEHPHPQGPQISVRMRHADRNDLVYKIGALVGIVVLVVAGWFLYDMYQDRQRAVVPAPVEPANVAPTPPPVIETVPTPTPPITQMQEVTGGAEIADQMDVGGANETDAVANATEEAGRDASTEVQAAASESESPADVAQTHRLRVSARAASWLQVKADGKVEEHLLRKGESIIVKYGQSLRVKFGNAGGVSLELDGKPYNFTAAPGEVKTLDLP